MSLALLVSMIVRCRATYGGGMVYLWPQKVMMTVILYRFHRIMIWQLKHEEYFAVCDGALSAHEDILRRKDQNRTRSLGAGHISHCLKYHSRNAW